MSTNPETPNIPVPRGWKQRVRSAVLHVISLAQFACACTRGWAASSTNSPVRLKAELDRARADITLLRQEIRIKDVRTKWIPSRRRPYCSASERMAITNTRVLPDREHRLAWLVRRCRSACDRETA